MGQTVSIGPRAGGGYALISRYDEQLIVIAKECGGRWKPAEKCWTFATLEQAKALANRLALAGFTVVSDFGQPPPATGASTAEVDRLKRELQAAHRTNIQLRGELASERRRASLNGGGLEVEALLREFGLPMYRALTRVAHPDAGGTHEAMVKINKLWDRIGRSA